MESSTTLDDCLKLLKGERDEQKLAGLLLVTKLFKASDQISVLKVYEAVGPRFLDRLLMTGTGTGPSNSKGAEDMAAYLRLSVTVLAAFCHVPEIALSADMISKIPLLLQALSSPSGHSISEEIYEALLLVATASEDGFTRLQEYGVIRAMSSNISTVPDGSKSMEMAMKLLLLILGKVPLDHLTDQYKSEVSKLVPTIARQFSVLHNELKFDALHVLATILSMKDNDMEYVILRPSYNDTWPSDVLKGVLDILQNRVVSAEKLQALSLCESMMSIIGEEWVLNLNHQPVDQKPFPFDKSLFLVLQTTRVEVAILLNELAYLKYEAEQSSSAESIQLKLGLLFSLLEKIIRLVSNASQNQGTSINETTLMKVVGGLNETTGLVLDFLQDARDHGDRKGDDLLAAVRIVGRYLAEAPSACSEKIGELLKYILSIEGRDETSPFSCIKFMLPMLCQLTMDAEGCSALASFGGHKSVAQFLTSAIRGDLRICNHDYETMFLACDTILNILLSKEKVQPQPDVLCFVSLLEPLASWAEETEETSVVMMASSICSLVLELTSEEFLLSEGYVSKSSLHSLSSLIATSLGPSVQLRGDDVGNSEDLRQIISSGYYHWCDRFPTLKRLIETQLLHVPSDLPTAEVTIREVDSKFLS